MPFWKYKRLPTVEQTKLIQKLNPFKMEHLNSLNIGNPQTPKNSAQVPGEINPYVEVTNLGGFIIENKSRNNGEYVQ